MTSCPACGFDNVDGVRFCGGCGIRLEQVTTASGRERKIVSVLFCDLVGFTAASDGADPEDVQAALTPYHARARLEIERFGGTVEKFIGDAVMAAFGAPVVHEDDAERAVRAGLRLLAAVDDLNEQHGLDLTVRIGIATGPAVVSTGARPERGEGMLAGDVVNTAARLQTAAAPGSVVVGEATWRATRAVIEYEGIDPVTVKGKADPLAIWVAVGARSRVGEAVASTSTALVGRGDELEMLERTFARCLRESSVQLATIIGEPGVGKSRLVQEFFEWIDAREELITWRQGRCPPYGEATTFWALGQVIKAQAGILDTDSRDVVEAKITEGITAVMNDSQHDQLLRASESHTGWLTARLGPLVGLPGTEASREELFTACQRFLEAIAATGPLVIVIEDLHWADQALLDFCEHLLQWVSDVPMMLVATARPELFDRAPTWGSGHRNATTIGLSRLTDAETALLVTGLLGAAVLPAETHAQLLQRADGNPLYAEEFIRMLADQGQLPRKSTTSQTSPHHQDELANLFPDSVQVIIAARLDTLQAASKALLLDAAVIGQTFWSGVVSALSGRPDSEVRATLHELSRRDYLRPARLSTLADHVEYTFAHALINEVAYEQIPRSERAAKHQKAARWTAELAGDDSGSLAAVIAHHYNQAHHLASIAGRMSPADQTELRDQARRWNVRAAEHVLALDPDTARRYFEAALQLTDEGASDHPALLTSLGGVLRALGEFAAADQAYRESQTEYAALGDPQSAASAAIHRSRILSDMGRGAEATDLLDRCTLMLEEGPPGPELVHAYSERAAEHMLSGRDRQAIVWADRALRLAKDIEQPEQVRLPVLRALMSRGMSRLELGEPGGDEDQVDVLAMAAEYNFTDAAIATYSNLGAHMANSESPAAALDYYDKSINLARERGRQVLGAAMSFNKAVILTALGRWSEAVALAQQSIDVLVSHGDSRDLLMLRLLIVNIRIAQGDETALQLLREEILPAARETREPGVVIDALKAAYDGALTRSDQTAADEAARELEAFLVSEPEAAAYGPASSEIARILAPAGKSDIVERIIALTPTGMPGIDLSVASARAILLEYAGDLEAAADQYRQAADGWRDYGYPYEEAYALLGAGRCSTTLHEPAIDTLERARSIFARLGAKPLLTETEKLLTSNVS